MNPKMNQVRAWKEILSLVSKVQDPLLRRALLAEFRDKAIKDWGWDPTGHKAFSENVELDEYEKDFVKRVQISQQLGIYMEGKEDQKAQARANMLDYVRDGGTLEGIPDNIRTPDIEKLYWECKNTEHDEMMAQCDNIIAQMDETESGPEPIGAILPRVLAETKANMETHNDKK